MEKSKSDEPPSIIQEIVIYNKPNANPVVPDEILPSSKEVSLGQGDIVISRVRTSLRPSTTSEESDQESEESFILSVSEEETQATVKKEESVEKDSETTETEEENVTYYDVITDGSSAVEIVAKAPKNDSKSKTKTSDKELASVADTNAFKRPRGRPKKSIVVTPQKSNLNNFVIRVNSSETTDVDKNESVDTPAKRTRGRPKKVNKEEQVSDKISLEEDEVTPSKRRKENKVVKTYTRKDTLRGSSDMAKKQKQALDAVEEELQSMFEEGNNAKKTDKKSRIGSKKKSLAGQQKITSMLNKAIKTEASEENPADPSESPFNEDDDSRTEWMPEEYVEYKQKHLIKSSKKSVHQCKYCGQDFNSYYSMRKHRALEHDDLGKDRKEALYGESAENEAEEAENEGDSDEESRGEWMPQDYAEYKLKRNLDKMKRTQWYKCKICCSVFSNYYKLSKHKTEHQNKATPYECKFCEASFGDIETLMAHLREHQGKDPYQCKKCEKGFKTKEELDQHMPVHVLKKGPPPVKKFRCDVCGKEFVKLCDIERHTRVHTGEKSCECKICHKRFQQSHNLSKHLLIHLHVKPFQCAICNKKFGRIDVLNRHLLTHSMEKPFKCGGCNKGFIREVQLKNHLRKHHPEQAESADEVETNEHEEVEDEETEERVIPNEEALAT